MKSKEQIEQLAEHYWEGCDGCDENDKYFFVKGFGCAYRQLKEDMADKKYTQEDVINKLKQGGYTIFFRHSITPGKDPHKVNPPGENIYNCSTQRPLTDEGREQAKLIGAKFKEHGIPVGEVYASIICRCEETAKLAFGKATAVTWMITGPRTSSLPELKKELLRKPAPNRDEPAASGPRVQ